MHKDLKVQLEHKDHRVIKVLKGLKDRKVKQELKDHKVIKDHKVT